MTRRDIEDEGGGKKSISRSSESWAWVSPLPECDIVYISLEFLTKQKNAVILFSEVNQFYADKFNRKKAANKEKEKNMKAALKNYMNIFDKLRTTMSDDDNKYSNLYKNSFHGSYFEYFNEDNIPLMDSLLVDIIDEHPRVLINLGSGQVNLTLNASLSVSDNRWHRLDIIWKDHVSSSI